MLAALLVTASRLMHLLTRGMMMLDAGGRLKF